MTIVLMLIVIAAAVAFLPHRSMVLVVGASGIIGAASVADIPQPIALVTIAITAMAVAWFA